MAAVQLQRVTYINDKINEGVKDTIVIHRKGIAHFFIKEDIFHKDLRKILQTENLNIFTSLRCKENRYIDLLANGSIVVEDYIIPDPTIPDNILPALF